MKFFARWNMKNQTLLALASAAALSHGLGCSAGDVLGDELVDIDEAAIIGGANADITNHPWQVSLQTSDGAHLCGGSILGEMWILTAQHCVDGSGAVLRSPASLRVTAGASKLSDMAIWGQTRSVDEIIPYPDYINALQGKDVALLRLASPLTLGPKVQPIAMATPGDEAAG